MNHIAYGVTWWAENSIRKVETSWEPPAPHKTKGATIKYLEKSFNSLKKILNSVDLNEEAILGVLATLNHVTHHWGQATMYVRCNGITPAEYTF